MTKPTHFNLVSPLHILKTAEKWSGVYFIKCLLGIPQMLEVIHEQANYHTRPLKKELAPHKCF